MRIILSSIPKKLLRCNQAGDWEYTKDIILVSVDDNLPNDSQLAVAIHELIEAWNCRRDGVTDKQVCDFDHQYEKERAEGKHSETDEPGDDPHSPYRVQHQDATHVERAVCSAIGLGWREHNAVIP